MNQVTDRGAIQVNRHLKPASLVSQLGCRACPQFTHMSLDDFPHRLQLPFTGDGSYNSETDGNYDNTLSLLLHWPVGFD